MQKKDVNIHELFKKLGLTASDAETGRLIRGGGARIEGIVIDENKKMASDYGVNSNCFELAAGKKARATFCYPENDLVNKPFHYNAHPSGIECIEVVRHMAFNIGNAIKYLWRAGLKGDAIEDLKKARWYIDDEIAKREKERASKNGG